MDTDGEKKRPGRVCLCMPDQIIVFFPDGYPGNTGFFRDAASPALRLICFGMRQFFYASEGGGGHGADSSE